MMQELTEEYTKVLEQKKEWYREYREVRSEMQKISTRTGNHKNISE